MLRRGLMLLFNIRRLPFRGNMRRFLSYVLQTHIAAREAEDGHITVPKKTVLAPPEELPEDVAVTLKNPKQGLEAVRKLWDAFVVANPELAK